jgi:hypothetical protein
LAERAAILPSNNGAAVFLRTISLLLMSGPAEAGLYDEHGAGEAGLYDELGAAEAGLYDDRR